MGFAGCQPEESYCYTGINAKNTPRHFVMVERADRAEYYVADPSDQRLTSIYDTDEDYFDEAGNFLTPWPSCQNIDSFDDVQHIMFTEVNQINGKRITSDPAPCETLLFSGETNLDPVKLYAAEGLPARKWLAPRVENSTFFALSVYHFISWLNAKSIAVKNINDTYAAVFISHIAEEDVFSPENNAIYPYLPPRDGRSAFEGKGKKGNQPPFVLVRLRRFKNQAQPEADVFFGKEAMEDSGYLCGDVYYGYFGSE